MLPSSIQTDAYLKDSLRLLLGRIDDCDQVFWNGKKIGQTGQFPTDAGGYATAWATNRRYTIAQDDPILKWDHENVIAIRVYDGNGGGGMYAGEVNLDMIDVMDYVTLNAADDAFTFGEGFISKSVTVKSTFQKISISGKLTVEMRGKNKI